MLRSSKILDALEITMPSKLVLTRPEPWDETELLKYGLPTRRSWTHRSVKARQPQESLLHRIETKLFAEMKANRLIVDASIAGGSYFSTARSTE